jgi:hypothetical protein
MAAVVLALTGVALALLAMQRFRIRDLQEA